MSMAGCKRSSGVMFQWNRAVLGVKVREQENISKFLFLL